VEAILAEVWRDVLGVATVGRGDNFFRLGGDSILSMQVVARAAQRGVQVSPRQVFGTPTLAALAAVAGTDRVEVDAEQGLVTGDVPLTPAAGGYRPSDFPDIGLQQEELDALVAQLSDAGLDV
jgi:aryl carrier-like protein